MKRWIVVLAIALVGCGHPGVMVNSPVTTPLALIDVPAFLFSTQARDIAVTRITDLYDLVTGAIQRTAHPDKGPIDARDHYQVNRAANCIEVWSVDTYQYDLDKTWLRYQQIYPTHPCWVGALTFTVGQEPVVSKAINNAPYYWRQFDKSGNQVGADFTDGKWTDWTSLICTASGCELTEFYDDLTNPDVVSEPYCRKGNYDALGLAKLSLGKCD